MNIEQKHITYMKWLSCLREDKVSETKKKLAVYGYTDEDDYNMLAPPDGYDWRPEPTHENGDFHGFMAWAENYKSMTESFPPVVVGYAPMAGNYFKILHKFRKLRWHPDWDISDMAPLIDLYKIDHCMGQVHHFCGDVRIGLELGWGGLLKKVHHYAKINSDTPDKSAFYQAEEMFITAVIMWIRRTSAYIARKIIGETDPSMGENLREMYEANCWIEVNPPRNMREACQFISWYNIAGRCYNREGCGGQLDELLRPYFEKDMACGCIDEEDAIFFIAGILLSDTKYYQLGGPDVSGKDMVSRVSWLVLEAADRLDITANLTVRVHSDMNRDFFRHSVELLFKHKNAWPRFSGDKSLVEGFVKNGFSSEMARERIAVGCNWMATPGVEYCVNDSIKLNFARIFEISFYEVTETDANPSCDKIWECFVKHLNKAMEVVIQTTELHLHENKNNSPELFLNLFSRGPVELGRDASDGSMQFYNIGIDGAGIAVAADSFAAMEQRIEREGCLTWEQVISAVRSNYTCENGSYIQNILKKSEKYGQWDSLGEKWAVRISRKFTEIAVSSQTKEGARFIPGLFSWSKTILFGKYVGATPDGRAAGMPINHGANPMPGSVPNGEMTTLSEAIVAVQCGRGNTAPFQMELDPMITDAEGGVDKVMALIETHLDRGGTLVNVNIVDAEKICAAHNDPSLYPDLVVRVTGFTAYFISLSPEFRQLVIDRLMVAN